MTWNNDGDEVQPHFTNEELGLGTSYPAVIDEVLEPWKAEDPLMHLYQVFPDQEGKWSVRVIDSDAVVMHVSASERLLKHVLDHTVYACRCIHYHGDDYEAVTDDDLL